MTRTTGRLLLWAIAMVQASGLAAAETIDWEHRPYRVQLEVVFAPGSTSSADQRDGLRSSILTMAGVTLGPAWRFEPASSEDVKDELDKIVTLTLDVEGSMWKVTAQERDLATDTIGAIIRHETFQRGELAATVARAIGESLRPLARIDTVAGQTVRLRVRAQDLGPDGALVKPDALLVPVIVFRNAYDVVQRIEPIDWTVLQVTSIGGPRVESRMYTGLRSPLTARRRGRVEPLALVTNRTSATSRLVLESRSLPHRPLVGYDVYTQSPGHTATTHLGRTDFAGEIEIPPTNEPLRILYIKHGGELLARLPLVTGLSPQTTAYVASDDARLEVEGVIAGMQERLVDRVAQRSALLVQAQMAFENGKFDEARERLILAKKAIQPDEWTAALDRERKHWLSGGTMSNKVAQLFDDTRQIVDHVAVDKRIADLEQELASVPATP